MMFMPITPTATVAAEIEQERRPSNSPWTDSGPKNRGSSVWLDQLPGRALIVMLCLN